MKKRIETLILQGFTITAKAKNKLLEWFLIVKIVLIDIMKSLSEMLKNHKEMGESGKGKYKV